MSIELFGPDAIASLRRAGRAAAATLALVGRRLEPGVDDRRRRSLGPRGHGARAEASRVSSGTRASPRRCARARTTSSATGSLAGATCSATAISLNVDVTTRLDGFHGDTSATFLIGVPSAEARHVVDVARRCRDAGIAVVRDGARLGDVGAAIEELARREGCSVVREYGGHGIGRKMHAEPHVPHVGARGTGLRLRAGMALTIEPMVNLGGAEIRVARRRLDRGDRATGACLRSSSTRCW